MWTPSFELCLTLLCLVNMPGSQSPPLAPGMAAGPGGDNLELQYLEPQFSFNSLILLEHLDFKCLLKHCKQISFGSAALCAVLQYILSTLELLVIH